MAKNIYRVIAFPLRAVLMAWSVGAKNPLLQVDRLSWLEVGEYTLLSPSWSSVLNCLRGLLAIWVSFDLLAPLVWLSLRLRLSGQTLASFLAYLANSLMFLFFLFLCTGWFGLAFSIFHDIPSIEGYCCYVVGLLGMMHLFRVFEFYIGTYDYLFVGEKPTIPLSTGDPLSEFYSFWQFYTQPLEWMVFPGPKSDEDEKRPHRPYITLSFTWAVVSAVYSLLALVTVASLLKAHDMKYIVECVPLDRFLQLMIVFWALTAILHPLGAAIRILTKSPVLQLAENVNLATNMTEFWGRRYNMVVHRVLHRSFYVPFSRWTKVRALGSLMSFAASTVLHEFAILLAFGGIGEQTGFFLSHGLFVALEMLTHSYWRGAVTQATGLKWFLLRLMGVIYTNGVLIATAPLFMEPMVRGGFFDSFAALVPIVVRA